MTTIDKRKYACLICCFCSLSEFCFVGFVWGNEVEPDALRERESERERAIVYLLQER